MPKNEPLHGIEMPEKVDKIDEVMKMLKNITIQNEAIKQDLYVLKLRTSTVGRK